MILLTALVVAQSGFSFYGKDNSLEVHSGKGKVLEVGQNYKLVLSNGVNLQKKDEKIVLTASQVTAMIVKDAGAKQPNTLRTAVATGKVKVVQTGQNVTANLQSNEATYTKGQGKQAIVQATGNVRLQHLDSGKRQTLLATGRSGSANLDPNSKRGISKALLNGPVRLEAVRASAKGSKWVFTGNKLTVDGNVAKLIGNAKMVGTGYEAEANVFTAFLNDSGEVVGFESSSGAGEMLLASFAPIASQGQILFDDKQNSIKAYNHTSANAESRDDGAYIFKMIGNPAIVESRLDGMTVSAPSISGIFGPQVRGQRTRYIEKLDVTGGATVVYDSGIKLQTEQEFAKKYGTPEPESRVGKDVSTMKTDRFEYNGVANEGAFAFPAPFTIHTDSRGQRLVKGKPATATQPAVPDVLKEYHAVADVDGISGLMNINPAAKKLGFLQTGSINGPVTMTIKVTEKAPSLPDEVTDLKMLADRIDFDLVKENTITLTGNVVIEGETNTFVGKSEGDLAVLTVDPATLKVLKIRITADPTKSTFREKKPVKSGGGR